MNIIFTQIFDKGFIRKFGIRPRHVRSVINKPDQQIPVTFFEDLEIIFYCKKIESGKTTFYWLVHGHMKDNEFIVGSAWRIYPDIHPDIEHLNPLQMLHLFAQTYGLELTIAGTTDRLHFKQELIVSDISEAQIMQINNPNNHSFITSTFIKVKNVTEGKKIQCALAYCIDQNKYSDWIGRSSGRSKAKAPQQRLTSMSEGSITFWVNHDNTDWFCDEHEYNFGPFEREGIRIEVKKHSDKTIEITVDGLMNQLHTFRHNMPICDERGLSIAITWGQKKISLYMNAKQVESRKL